MRPAPGERAAADRLDRAGALDRGGVDDQQVVIEAGTHRREVAHERLDALGQSGAALVVGGPQRQLREQVTEALARDGQEALVGRDSHDRLGDRERDDLCVGHDPPGVPGPHGQEIVCGAEHRNEQQVEVGEHRGPLGRRRELSTADFDPLRYVPSSPRPHPRPWNYSSSGARP